MNINFTQKILITLVLAFLLWGNSYAQQTQANTDSVVSKHPQTVFFELFGPGLIYSVNYDTRFTIKPDGLGIRMGVGYTPARAVPFLPYRYN